MIRHLQSSVFDTYASIVAHQVNCFGTMGSGVASQVKQKYPDAYKEYKAFCDKNKDSRIRMLGAVQMCPVSRFPDGSPRIYIANLFAQYNYGRDKNTVYTNYEALRRCLLSLSKFASESNRIIAIPYKMGCDRGGGDWDGRVLPMIADTLADNEVLICRCNP